MGMGGGQHYDPAALSPEKKTGTHLIGSCLGLGAGLYGYGKLNILCLSNPGPSCPQQVDILTMLSRTPKYNYTKYKYKIQKTFNPKLRFLRKLRFANDLFSLYLQTNFLCNVGLVTSPLHFTCCVNLMSTNNGIN